MNIYDLTLKELEEKIIEMGEKKYKALQIYTWLYKKKVKSFDEMTDIKKEFIEKLKENFVIGTIKIEQVERDKDVNKYLFRLSDNEFIEAVLMRHDYGLSICVSSQIGCNMGCKFCESGRRKKVRNLTTGEVVEQILLVEEDLKERISHVVVMGIGEPFDNYENIIRFIRIINDPKGLEIGIRHITVSTCGLVIKIDSFAHDAEGANLAVSLHAPTNEVRNKIMPINKVYKVEEIISAIKKYIEKTNRRVTFEYIMLKDINDTDKCAEDLSKLLKGINCYVNLIPYNETANIEFKRSDMFQIMKFYDILKKNNINVTIRREFGSKISAACGQLRSKKEEA
jgi:23S rRNA (adenine2503-C2)-methyltransferase